MEFNDNYPEYEKMSQHSDAEGVPMRKKLWKVFWILLIITIVEVMVGFFAKDWNLSKFFLKMFFIFFTLVKAYYIVYSFMHLGHEKKMLKYTIVVPFSLFIIYLIYIVAAEGTYSYDYREEMDKGVIQQQEQLKTGEHGTDKMEDGHQNDTDHQSETPNHKDNH